MQRSDSEFVVSESSLVVHENNLHADLQANGIIFKTVII